MTHFPTVWETLREQLIDHSDQVGVGSWHGMDVRGQEALETDELTNVRFSVQVPRARRVWEYDTKPNMPWAEAHFQERIGGLPLNPPPSHEIWPWSHSQHQEGVEQTFSHTYPERFWAIFANEGGKCADSRREIAVPHVGIRYEYGDYLALLGQLSDDPLTRQAYLPIWFPEDTALGYRQPGTRVPCTLGYHFLIRNHALQMTYYLRSCDFVRHFRDDVYLAGRLMQHTVQNLSDSYFRMTGEYLEVGELWMNIVSLHSMVGDRYTLNNTEVF